MYRSIVLAVRCISKTMGRRRNVVGRSIQCYLFKRSIRKIRTVRRVQHAVCELLESFSRFHKGQRYDQTCTGTCSMVLITPLLWCSPSQGSARVTRSKKSLGDGWCCFLGGSMFIQRNYTIRIDHDPRARRYLQNTKILWYVPNVPRRRQVRVPLLRKSRSELC